MALAIVAAVTGGCNFHALTVELPASDRSLAVVALSGAPGAEVTAETAESAEGRQTPEDRQSPDEILEESIDVLVHEAVQGIGQP